MACRRSERQHVKLHLLRSYEKLQSTTHRAHAAGLPVDLRKRVWEHVWPGVTATHILGATSLLPTLVCRQIHHETAVLAFQRTVFQMHDQFMGSLFDRVYNVPPGQSSLITSLAVNVDCQHDSPLLESPFYWFSILRHQNLALSNLLVFLIPTEQLGRGVPAMEDLINALLKNVSQAKSIEQIVIVGHSET